MSELESCKDKYEVHTNYGAGYYQNEHDAIMTLLLLSSYDKVIISYREVKEKLDRDGEYEKFPLSIIKMN